ncbi:capsule assembly Wzi family protein [Spirosoma sp. KCTC 42546]|uniref:capsule assembly Wzi family protein n=1 Tax=Spirosoma sp. KCTC 42546 TaxID=2520506 RepID=UPI001156FE61|nr:capsule assembly Wzi family protein [Spirosoma sp. KCTC 42546]QDK83078.1 capsule assembly Wzi family protein [Spirosoma sp. KCTC 42546]
MRFLFLWIWYGLIIIASCTLLYGQRVNQYQLEVGALGSSAQTPFWLRANQYGTVPLKNPALQLNAGFRLDYQPIDSTGYKPKMDWGYGINVVANLGTTTQFLLPEAYVKGRFGAFELYAGRRKEMVGLVDTLLTTGAYAWSGNALPIPKIQLGLPTFTSLPFTKGVVSMMGAFSHGWFENSDRLVTGSYLHQLYIYGRIGKPSWKFRLYGGFNHEVIWAGYSNYLGPVVSVNGQLPSSIRYYPAVVLGTRGADYTTDKNLTSFEDNRIGNHLGSLDAAADMDLSNWNIFIYRQFLYDDGSLFYGTNLQDGLNGLRLKNRQKPTGGNFFLRQITVEYLFTGSQGGDVFIIDDPKRRGRDDYFNHSQFIDGWTYFGRTIGTPFLIPQQEISATLPSRYGIANNRVSVFHAGLSALVFNKVDLIARLSFSKNAGTYAIPYLTIPSQFSGLFTASLPLNLFGGTILNGSFAVDAGELLPNSVGAYVGLRKTGMLSGKRQVIISPRRGF